MSQRTIPPQRVAVVRQQPRYHEAEVTASVRHALDALGISFSELIKPGERALLKPNFIRESHIRNQPALSKLRYHGGSGGRTPCPKNSNP